MDSQLKGTFFGCQVIGEFMLKKGKGSIINVSSASAGPPLSKAFTYSAAKAGIKNLTQNLGREWGDKGVRVNAIRPGVIKTDLVSNELDGRPELEKHYTSTIPMKRFGKPEEVSELALWLLSDSSSFVSGARIDVSGGGFKI